MKRYAPILALALGLTAATAANADVGRWGSELRYVADTTVPTSAASGVASLCHIVESAEFLSLPVYTRTTGYSLSPVGCSVNLSRKLSMEEFVDLQIGGYIPQDIPIIATSDITSRLWGHAWLVFGGLAVVLAAARITMGARKPRRAPTPDALAIHSLVAMSQVAIADGRIEDGEVLQIAHILTRLTGKSYGPGQVMEMLKTLNPSASDLAQVGEDLSDKERQIVLEAALNIAAADRDIHPTEYAVVSELAQRMRIGSDQFRTTLARLSAHLQTVRPV